MLQLLDWFFVLRRPRGGEETLRYDSLRCYLDCVTLVEDRDSWIWLADPFTVFFVASSRILIDYVVLSSALHSTRLNNFVSSKVNNFVTSSL